MGEEMSKYRVVFMGTPAFAVSALDAVMQDGHEIAGVFTQPDKINRRNGKIGCSPVKEYALVHGIPVHQPASMKSGETEEILRAASSDVILVAAYGRILPASVLNIPKYGCINIHASLLPRYRGAAPIQRAILNGDEETGVTIMKMEAGLDTGDIISVRKMPLPADITAGELFERLSGIGAEEICRVLSDLPRMLERAVKQRESEASYAEKITKEMGRIRWEENGKQLYALIRALYPSPGTYTIYRGKRLKIHRAVYPCGNGSGTPGTVASLDGGIIYVHTGSGLIGLSEVQPENKKKMSAADFINGYKVKIDESFT